MSSFTDLIRSELDKRGWSYTDFALRIEEIAQRLRDNDTFPDAKGIHQSSISYMMKRETIPELPTLHLMALALDVPLRQLISALGYPIDTYTPENAARATVLSQIDAGSDELVEAAKVIASLSVDERKAVLAFVDYLRAHKER